MGKSAAIVLKFCTDFDHMTRDLPYKFKVKGSKVKVTAWCKRGKNVLNCPLLSWDRSISLKLTTDYDLVTQDVPQTFKVKGVKGQGHGVT